MSRAEKYEEILKFLERIPKSPTPALPETISEPEEQQFIVIDHNSDPTADFTCYAELESASR